MGAQHTLRRTKARAHKPFSPLTDLSTAPALWLRASAITPVADGTAVATWSDASGNARDATQATGTKQPLYRTAANGIGGRPALDFDGTDDAFGVAWTPPVGQMLLVAVCEVDVTSAGNRTVIAGNVTTAMELRASGGNWQTLRQITAIIGSSAVAAQNALLASRRDSAGNISHYKNAKTAAQASTATAAYSGASTLIGGLSASSFFDGKIAEIIGFSSDISSGDFTTMMNGLGLYYGITVGA